MRRASAKKCAGTRAYENSSVVVEREGIAIYSGASAVVHKCVSLKELLILGKVFVVVVAGRIILHSIQRSISHSLENLVGEASEH